MLGRVSVGQGQCWARSVLGEAGTSIARDPMCRSTLRYDGGSIVRDPAVADPLKFDIVRPSDMAKARRRTRSDAPNWRARSECELLDIVRLSDMTDAERRTNIDASTREVRSECERPILARLCDMTATKRRPLARLADLVDASWTRPSDMLDARRLSIQRERHVLD